ncbi:MAG: hypothetical protein ACE5OO_07180, partial [Candidatus Bathyarchaeia archaeon]
MSEIIPLDRLLRSRGAPLLCYPRFDAEEAERRLREMCGLGVEALELRGRHKVDEVPVLGKGHVGVVVAARVEGRPAALKIRRVDADRDSLAAEAANLEMANGVSVGPRLMAASRNFLVMELIEGEYLIDWVGGLEPSDGDRLRLVLRRLLDKARSLDLVGLDHGELSRAHRHVMVAGAEPRIIDFESASRRRRAANVTSIAQYLYFNRRTRSLIEAVLRTPGTEELLEALRRYKRAPTDGNYSRFLDVCGGNFRVRAEAA